MDPPHFWALSLYRSDEYEKAGANAQSYLGMRNSKNTYLYVGLAPLGVMPAVLGTASWALVVAGFMGLMFVWLSLQIIRHQTDNAARKTSAFLIISLCSFRCDDRGSASGFGD